jgi:ribosomal protein L11 methylase PrmA
VSQTAPSVAGPDYDPGSFRDPSSRVWRDGDRVFRGLDERAAADYERLTGTRFFAEAIGQGQIVGTGVADDPAARRETPWTTVLEHDLIPVVTYPYEWSFTMLKDAALLTLRLIRAAIDEGFTTADASSYNVQFVGARPTFIDVASFEPHREGEPWWGYRQFCQLFLYPLMLTAYKDLPHQPWLRGAVDGITPEQAHRVLQGRKTGRKGLLAHVWLHARADRRIKEASTDMVDRIKRSGYNRTLYVATIDRLIELVDGLEWRRVDSTWGGYGGRGHYETADLEAKQSFVRKVTASRRRAQVWDIGANDGMFSHIAAEHADTVLAIDADDLVIDRLYRDLREGSGVRITPMVMNLADPSPGIGWNGAERPPLGSRSRPDVILALAVIHHLALTYNVPTSAVLDMLASVGDEVLLEVPSETDPMVKSLKRQKRAGTHDSYDLASIEAQIRERFQVRERVELPSGTRVLFHLGR